MKKIIIAVLCVLVSGVAMADDYVCSNIEKKDSNLKITAKSYTEAVIFASKTLSIPANKVVCENKTNQNFFD